MSRLNIAAAAVLMCVLAVSCQQQQQPDGDGNSAANEQKMPPPIHLGAVHQVYPEQNFALLRIIGPMPRSGTVLITHPMDGTNSRIGNLVVSSEFAARNGIIAADIRSGTVVKGDRVFQYRNISRQTKQTEEQESQETVEHPILDTVPDEVVVETESPPAPGAVTTAEEDAPSPATESAEPTFATPPTAPEPVPATQGNTPSYLDDIPDDISGWN